MPVPSLKLPTICIDPGHPSEVNSGAQLQNGLREVEVVYDVAIRLKKMLEEGHIARVVMTRDFKTAKGSIVTNRRRAEMANKANAVLLLRLHCDTGYGSGCTIYFPDRTGKNNGIVGPSQTVIHDSKNAAISFHKGIVGLLKVDAVRDNGVKGDSATYIGRKQGALTGSIYSKVPTLTVEMVYLSNPNDAQYIGSNAGQRRMAKILSLGIVRYLQTLR